MDSINALKVIIRTQKKDLYDKAFGIYCKRVIAESMDAVDKARERYYLSAKEFDEINIEKLKVRFERTSPQYNASPKELIIKELKNKT